MPWTAVGSIRGPQGAQGPTGAQGPAGATGAQGPSGVTTLRGATDYDNSVAPVDMAGILWVAADGKFKPVVVEPLSKKGTASGYAELDSNGRLLSARAPLVATSIRLGNVTTNVTSDASTTAGNLLDINANGNIIVDAPISPSNFQQFRYHIRANGAARTVTFGSAIKPAKNLPLGLGPYSLARGEILVALMDYLGTRQTTAGVDEPVWGLLAAAIV